MGQHGESAATVETLELLRAIRGELVQANQRLDRVETGLIQVNMRLDRVIENSGEHWRDHEERLRKLESALGR